MTSERTNPVRDVDQAELLESSRELRAQLQKLVGELEAHVRALQAEVDRLQGKGSNKEPPGD